MRAALHPAFVARAWPLLGLTLALLFGCGEPPREPLRVVTNNWPGFWPLYLVEGEKRLGAHLQELSSASQVLRAFRNHEVDAAALTSAEFLQLLDEGNAPRIYAVIDYSNGADTLLARPPITRPADLRGRVVAAESTALGVYLIHRALQRDGLDENDVHIVGHDFADHEGVYTRGEVDAVVTFEPNRGRLLAQGAREIFSSADIPGEVTDVLVVHEQAARERRADLDRLMASWYEGIATLRRDPVAAAERLAFITRLSPSQFQQAMAGVHLIDAEENHRLLGGELRPHLERLAGFMRDAGMLRNEPPLDQAFAATASASTTP